jgi:3-oxoacyl-[acyl-carrier protein] reductase
MDLNGKVAIVTGGNGGLGRRICLALDLAGCQIAVLYNLPGEADDAMEFASGLGDAKPFQVELREVKSVNGMVAAVHETFGRVDILINDAAFNKFIAFDDLDALTFEIWEKILDINLNGPMRCIKAVAPLMKEVGGGRIVNISSTAGFGPSGSSIPYATSKAALNHITKCFAVGLAPTVLVNGVAPGYMEGTHMSEQLDPAYRAIAKDIVALKRAADKDDIAKQVVLCCETDSMTGQTVVIDGGRYFR